MIVIIRLATIGRLNVYTDNHWQPSSWRSVSVKVWPFWLVSLLENVYRSIAT